MTLSNQIVLKSLLSTLSSKEAKSLIRFLPQKEAALLKEIEILPFSSPDPFFLFSLFERVHYSWFIPTIKSLEKEEGKLFISTFDKANKEKLKTFFSYSVSKRKISSNGKEYLQTLLLKSILPEKEELLPIEALPKSAADPLLYLSKKELISLIDYLGLYDLAREIKLLIDKELIEKLFDSLPNEHRAFIRSLYTYKEPFSSPSLELSTWDGDPSSLLNLLHKRGMNRLAKAISFTHKDFIWHITHTLDIGRGNFVNQLISKDCNPSISQTLLSNILELIEKPILTRSEAHS